MLTDETRDRDFPGLREMVYLNTAAESIPPRCVSEAVQRYLTEKQRGMHGREDHFRQVDACREVAARLLGLRSGEVSFCSCSSEAYNLLASALCCRRGDEVVVSDLDFPAGVTPWLRTEEPTHVRVWRARDGELQLDDLPALLSGQTLLVQVSLVSFYNGFRLPWTEFYREVRARAPRAVIAVDVTQALGRVVLDCAGADILISSTHKWTLGIHGGCVVGIPMRNAERLTTRAGGWYHLQNAFEPDRFERAEPKRGAASFSVGMPSFAPIYALNASLRYLEGVTIAAVASHADELMDCLDEGLRYLGLAPLCRWNRRNPSGILAFRHAASADLEKALAARRIAVMHHAGRVRVSIHGYNSAADVEALLAALAAFLDSR